MFCDAARNVKMRRRKLRKDQMIRFANSMKKDNSTNGPEIYKASYFENDYELGRRVSFVCVARGNPEPRVSWFKDGNEFIHHKYSRIAEHRLRDSSIKSRLEIDPARQIDAGNYECRANNLYSSDRRQFKAEFEDF